MRRVRYPVIPAQQAAVVPPPAQNGSLPYQGPDSKTNPHTPGLNGVTDTEARPRIVISRNIPGGQNQRNTIYRGGRQAIPGAEQTYRSASKGRHFPITESAMPSRYVFGGPDGGTDNLDDLMTGRRMPYTGQAGFRGRLGHARGSVRGAVLDGSRFFQLPDTELNQGGAYGRRIRGVQRHRPTIFKEPAPWSAGVYDTTAAAGGPDTPGSNSQVKHAVHVSPSATRRSWRRA